MPNHWMKPLLTAIFCLFSLSAHAQATVVNIYNFTHTMLVPIGEEGIREAIPPHSCRQVGITHFPVEVGFQSAPFVAPKQTNFKVTDPQIGCHLGQLYHVKQHNFCITKKTVANVYLLDLVVIGNQWAYLRNSLGDCPAYPVPWYVGV